MKAATLSICLKTYLTSKRFSLLIKSSKAVSNLLFQRSFSTVSNCSKKECKVLRKLSLFQRTTTSPKKTLKSSKCLSSKQKVLLILFTKRSKVHSLKIRILHMRNFRVFNTFIISVHCLRNLWRKS